MSDTTLAGLRDALIRDMGLTREQATRVIAFHLGVPPERFISHGESFVAPNDAAQTQALAARIASGEPIAYVVGRIGFYRREFLVDRRVLIPRPETEHLIDVVIARGATRILDVGTGSGAIACTLAAELPAARIDAIDVSPDALALARENARRLDVNVTFHCGDLLKPVAGTTYEAIVANLPYVPDGEGDPELRFEPAIALFAGADGLEVYRRFFAQVPPFVAPGGIVLAEGAPPTAAGLLALARSAFPGAAVSLERDYGGRERFVKVETPS